ncbi:16023_t:CDS:2, partial [Cetraspora pellucida]
LLKNFGLIQVLLEPIMLPQSENNLLNSVDITEIKRADIKSICETARYSSNSFCELIVGRLLNILKSLDL